MRHTFESLGYQSGFYLSHLFPSTRNPCSSSSPSSSTAIAAIHPPPPLFNWPHHQHRPPLLPSATTSILPSPANFHNSSALGLTIPQPKDQAHLFLHNHPSDQPPPIGDMMAASGDHENDLKWQNGLSFLNAMNTASRTEDAATDKLFLNPGSNPSASEFLSMDPQRERKMDKFKRSFTLPARMALSSSSSPASMDHHHRNQHQKQQQQPVDYRNSEGGPYQDVMETFLE